MPHEQIPAGLGSITDVELNQQLAKNSLRFRVQFHYPIFENSEVCHMALFPLIFVLIFSQCDKLVSSAYNLTQMERVLIVTCLKIRTLLI